MPLFTGFLAPSKRWLALGISEPSTAAPENWPGPNRKGSSHHFSGVNPLLNFLRCYMGVSKNGGTPQPLVFLLKMIIFRCFGEPPFKETPIYVPQITNRVFSKIRVRGDPFFSIASFVSIAYTTLIQRWGDHLYICPDHDKCILNHSKTYVICAKKDYDMPFYHDIPCGILYYFTTLCYVLPCCTSFSGDIKCSIPPKAKCRLSHAILQRKRQFSQLKIGERRFLSIGKHIIFSFRFLGGFLGG